LRGRRGRRRSRAAWLRRCRDARTTPPPWRNTRAPRVVRQSPIECRATFGKLLIHHERVDDVFSTALGNYGYIMRDPRLDPLLAASNQILARA
jgi:hypothetical protein